MLQKIYAKSELQFSLIWIAIYVVLLSSADNLSEWIGISKIVTAPLCIVLTVFMYLWICKNDLSQKYGLCRFKGHAKQYLYFIPLMLLCSTNLWWGVKLNYTVPETVLYIISMLCVGFLEEVIFRGFLFKAMCKDNVKYAVIVSSITFGIGHIVNLFNGKDIPETLTQVCYAAAIGFLFTIIFYKGKSLWPCIITHSVVNSLSVFANEDKISVFGSIMSCVFLCLVPICYATYILKKNKE